jgi:mono/diheme cytochrome c family protein
MVLIHAPQENPMLKSLVAIAALMLFGYPTGQPAGAPVQTAPAQATAIPADAAAMTNPTKPTAESLAKARKMYGYDCSMCHGDAGNGKGDLAVDLKLTLKDFTNAETMKTVTDGEMFWVIQNGIGKMPGEGDRLKPDDTWSMVVVVRSFAKK